MMAVLMILTWVVLTAALDLARISGSYKPDPDAYDTPESRLIGMFFWVGIYGLLVWCIIEL